MARRGVGQWWGKGKEGQGEVVVVGKRGWSRMGRRGNVKGGQRGGGSMVEIRGGGSREGKREESKG